VRRAEEKPLSVISNEMKDLGKRAKDRKLQPQEYQGGTTAVSNMGMMGVGLCRRGEPAACDHPGRRRRRAAPGRQGRRAGGIATVMTVTLSTDHRCVDGALGAELFKGAFKGYIENPMRMLRDCLRGHPGWLGISDPGRYPGHSCLSCP
jgi:pyruvate dehydrogenase E2 component (dihydrolipoamide acetyltransferase)